LLGASAAFATGGSISISTPSLSLGASGLTQGLYASVWHVPPPPSLGGGKTSSGYASYGIPAPTGTTAPTLSDVANVETYLNSGSYSSATTGVLYTLPATSETFLNTNDAFQYGGGYRPTREFFGADAAGAAITDGNPWYSSIVDQMGYIKVASAGTYNFNLSSADDAGAVYIGGTGITPSGHAGTGTQVVATSYNGSSIPAADGTASVTFSAAGYYPIEIMNYQQGGGAGFNLSVTGTSGQAASYYTTNAVASTVTPVAPAPTPSSAPAPTDEWNFAKSTINGTSVSDIGTAGTAATAGTITGTGVSVSGGALVTTNNGNGNGMSLPGSTFANYTGSFSIALTFNRSTSDPTNDWGSLMGFGTQGAPGSNFILLQPQRADGSNLSSLGVQSNGVNTMLAANNDQATPMGQKIQEVLVYDAKTNTASLYINGVLQMSGTVLAEAGQPSFDLASVADAATGTASDGIGGFGAFAPNQPTTLASYYDLSTWNSALSASQVAGLAAAATPEPASLALMAVAMGGLALAARKRHGRTL
jgi:hypothetical protein